MEENTNTISDSPVPTDESTSIGATPMATSSSNYASFWSRLAAALIDGFLLSLVFGLFRGFLGGSETFITEGGYSSTISTGYSSIPTILGWVYYVFMTAKYGQTLGKMALKIRVQNESTGENLTFVEALLREVVGKIVSSIVILLGYFWMLWDPKKQTWHDKIGKSVVVKA